MDRKRDGWLIGYGSSNVTASGVAEEETGNKYIYYERGNEYTYDTLCFNIANYITKGGDYRISIKYKVVGSILTLPILLLEKHIIQIEKQVWVWMAGKTR